MHARELIATECFSQRTLTPIHPSNPPLLSRQVAPRWLLEFWVGTLPLEMIVMIWDHMLRNAHATTPTVLNLQVCLILLSQLQSQLEPILATLSADDDPSSPAHHAAFSLLSSLTVPDASSAWLLTRAQQLRLNAAAVQDMRLQLRMALVERCAVDRSQPPCAQALPEARSRPLPLLTKERPPWWHPRTLCSKRTVSHAGALALATSALTGDIALLCMRYTKQPHERINWAVTSADTVLLLAACVAGTLVGMRWKLARPAVALGSGLLVLFLSAKALNTAIQCFVPSNATMLSQRPPEEVAEAEGEAAAAARASARARRVRPCESLEAIWPMVLVCLITVVTLLQVGLACADHMRSAPLLLRSGSGCYSLRGTVPRDGGARARGGRTSRHAVVRNSHPCANAPAPPSPNTRTSSIQ